MYDNNDNDSTHYVFNETSVRMNIRWTEEASDKLKCLLGLREKIDVLIFDERLRLATQPANACWEIDEPTLADVWDGDGTDQISY
jgi:hypothetical protein